MGYDFYSKNAHYAFQLARQEAIDRSSALLTTDHLLLGLLRQYTKKDGCKFFEEFADLPELLGVQADKIIDETPEVCAPSTATQILERFGITLDEARRRITNSNATESPSDFKLGPDVSRLIERAHELRREHNQNQLGTEHLLLALLEDENCFGYKILVAMNADTDGLRQNALSAIQTR